MKAWVTLTLLLAGVAGGAERMTVSIEANAAPAVRDVADHLGTTLGWARGLNVTFETRPPRTPLAIILRTRADIPAEGYDISHTGRQVTIAASDTRGMVYGVYRLLEQLGAGHYISGPTEPPHDSRPLSFDGVDVAAHPLVGRRIVFDWHNFLSSCSTWELDDWKAWTRSAQQQGFNTIMVHAYGNNPMVSWSLNGQTKPTGTLATTVSGRDWGTQHVNDVRRLVGGALFDEPVFGCHAGMVEPERRPAATRSMMQSVFNDAQRRGMDILFALDVDTVSANPQNIIGTLPRSARFRVGGTELPDPETPEGDDYYRAQMKALIGDYPQITQLVVWFRAGGTPWRDIKPADFPAGWRPAWQAALAKNPALSADRYSPSMFALAKVVEACRRGLKAAGREDVSLAFGTWHPDHMPAAHAFVARDVPFLWLDYGIVFDKPETLALNRRIGAERPVVPIVWAHHDDGQYLGRPFTPFASFQTKLEQGSAAGFGIIHWTTRPLDLYFRSLINQTWSDRRDEPLATTCAEAARCWFGAPQLGAYLQAWLTSGPIFGRETGNRLFDRTADPDGVLAGVKARLPLLDEAKRLTMTERQRAHVEYFRLFEQFCADFQRDQAALERSQALAKEGRLDDARQALAMAQPRATIGLYAAAAGLLGATPGERGLTVSLNTRWLPYFVDQGERLGTEPVRIKYGPTDHEPLAQGAGRYTFFVDRSGRLWRQRGQQETGQPAVVFDDGDDLARAGVRAEEPLTEAVPSLPAGRYRATALLRAGVGADNCRVAVSARSAETTAYHLDPTPARRLRITSHTSTQVPWTSIHEVKLPGLEPAETKSSGATAGYDAALAVDGKPETRWAVQGPSAWLELGLRPGTVVSDFELAWYLNSQRQPPEIEVALSADGTHWGPSRPLAAAVPGPTGQTARATRVAGGLLVARSLTFELAKPGAVSLVIQPVGVPTTVCGWQVEREEADRR